MGGRKHNHLLLPPQTPPSCSSHQTHRTEEEDSPLLKKTKKMEEVDPYGGDIVLMKRHKEALKSLIEKRTREVGRLKEINYDHISQLEQCKSRFRQSSVSLEDAEERLRDASSKLAFLQSALVRVDPKLPVPRLIHTVGATVEIEANAKVKAIIPRVDASPVILVCPAPCPSQQSCPKLFIPAPTKEASSILEKQTKRRVSKWSARNGSFLRPVTKKEPVTFPSSPIHMGNSNKQKPGHQELILRYAVAPQPACLHLDSIHIFTGATDGSCDC